MENKTTLELGGIPNKSTFVSFYLYYISDSIVKMLKTVITTDCFHLSGNVTAMVWAAAYMSEIPLVYLIEIVYRPL